MQFPDVKNRLAILTACFMLGTVLAGLSQDTLRVSRHHPYEESRTKNNNDPEQAGNAYPFVAAKDENTRQPLCQWWLDSRMVGNTGYDNGTGYEVYPGGSSTPVYNNIPATPFRWNDVAGITAMALGAYILFR